MSDEVYLKVVLRRSGGTVLKIEVRGSREDVDYFLEKVVSLSQFEAEVLEPSDEVQGEEELEIDLPSIKIERGDNLPSILRKMFDSEWGRKPRTLKEVIDALASMGQYFNKSTVAVTLKRLVERGELRRIKGDDKIYRYVSAGP